MTRPNTVRITRMGVRATVDVDGVQIPGVAEARATVTRRGVPTAELTLRAQRVEVVDDLAPSGQDGAPTGARSEVDVMRAQLADALAERDAHRQHAEQIAALLDATSERAQHAEATLVRVRAHFVSAHDDYLAERRRVDRAERRVQAVHTLLDDGADRCHDTVRIADVLDALTGRPDKAGDVDQAEPAVAVPCPHCPDGGHRDPTSRPWGVYVAPERDSDGQPVYLRVQPSNGAHVALSDAAWLWRLIRHAPSPAAQ